MAKTVADLINDYLAPEQPDYCREASKALLVAALKSAGPVVHRGRNVSLAADGKDVVVEGEETPEPEAPAEAPAAEPEPAAAPAPPVEPRPAEEMPIDEGTTATDTPPTAGASTTDTQGPR